MSDIFRPRVGINVHTRKSRTENFFNTLHSWGGIKGGEGGKTPPQLVNRKILHRVGHFSLGPVYYYRRAKKHEGNFFDKFLPLIGIRLKP